MLQGPLERLGPRSSGTLGGPALYSGDVAGGCKLLRNRYESRDREWATYTCVLGFHVYGKQAGWCRWSRAGCGGPGCTDSQLPGVWPDGSDGTDINSLCRSHHERVVAVADDFCKVHLFQYPCARAKVSPGLGVRSRRDWAGLGRPHGPAGSWASMTSFGAGA